MRVHVHQNLPQSHALAASIHGIHAIQLTSCVITAWCASNVGFADEALTALEAQTAENARLRQQVAASPACDA